VKNPERNPRPPVPTVLEAARALPARPRRAELAAFLSGADSGALMDLRDHPLFGALDEHSREAVREAIDLLLEEGTLTLARGSRVAPAE